ncbi:MAG: anti-virulence regulator CigR family protein, partial [Oceanisphaera sp.]|nr:anti-virulence regulator CigR family protein [Oceanisphaera sp.]
REDRRYPNIDEAALRLIFREHRDWLNDGQHRDALPPGIRKNLQRGKPLPPGIAKRFDPRLRERLPDYKGYEWQRVGDKAVLVDLATDNVRFILESIFD